MATRATENRSTLAAAGAPAVFPRRRAGLTQERSRDTRRRLVRTAMRLWTERGFETGIEDTTIDEIVQAAGVTKGTFYFHFARKEEILLELGYQTAALLSEEATRCLNAQRGIEDSLRKVTNRLVASVRPARPRPSAGPCPSSRGPGARGRSTRPASRRSRRRWRCSSPAPRRRAR